MHRGGASIVMAFRTRPLRPAGPGYGNNVDDSAERHYTEECQADKRVASADLHGRLHYECHIRRDPAPLSTRANAPTYSLLRRSLARSCSSASRSHCRAISIKVARGGPEGTTFASFQQSRASCRYSSALLILSSRLSARR
jgi:hypothetical protein